MKFVQPYIGQEITQRYLQKQLRSGKLPQAQLWIGPDQIGKRTLFANLIWQWFCENWSDSPCRQCLDCRLLATDSHPNLQWLTTKDDSRIGIEPVRQLIMAAAQTRLHRGPFIIGIDQAEQLTPAAANALLKLLEEPPAGVYLWLLTAHEEMILPTIRSRCSALYFTAVDDAAMRSLVNDASAIAWANGLPGRLQQWSTAAEHRKLVSIITDWIKIFTTRNLKLKWQTMDELLTTAKVNGSSQQLLALAQYLWRDVMLIKMGCQDALVLTEQRQALEQIAQSVTLEQTMANWQQLALAEQSLATPLQLKLFFHQLVLILHPTYA